MDENKKSNSMNKLFNDLNPNNSQEQYAVKSTDIYTDIEDNNSESN